MDLKTYAYIVEYHGKTQPVIDDLALLDWASRGGITPARAQEEAIRAGIIPVRYLRNLFGISMEEQARICGSKVFVCGLGGLGGIVVELLARLGVGRLRVADGDLFAPSNLNRQLLCKTADLQRPKALVAEERLKAVNPLIEVEPSCESVTEENAPGLLGGMDLVMDALDNIEGRFVLAATCRELGIPFIHAAVAGWWGQITTFLPDSRLGLSSVYGSRRKKDAAEDATGVLGPSAALLGSLAAFEATRILTGRPPAYSGRLGYFDGESGIMESAALG